MLRDAQRAHNDRLQRSLNNFNESRLRGELPAASRPEVHREEAPEPVRELNDADSLRTETIPLTLDEIEWLDGVVQKHGHTDLAGPMARLIDWANGESPELKKKLFLVVRCRRCSAGAKGGVKRDRDFALTNKQWQWLENVRTRCKHASIGKTLRIIIDFYMPLCQADEELAQKIFRLGATVKTERHEDAVKNVDPSRALAIRGGERRAPQSGGA